jgi:Cys-tRNA(Pro) deacylase
VFFARITQNKAAVTCGIIRYMTDSSIDSTPVTRHLEALGIPYRFFHHPGAVHSLEQAAAERGQRPEQIIRSIVFRLGEGEFVMALVAGPGQISWPALRKRLGVSRMTMASADEVLEATGYPLGAVSPFGLPKPMRILADESIHREGEISIGSGVRYTTVILRQEDLQRGLEAIGGVEAGQYLTFS